MPGGWVCQVVRYFRWVRKVGRVGSSGRFGQNSTQSVNQALTKVGIELLGQLKKPLEAGALNGNTE